MSVYQAAVLLFVHHLFSSVLTQLPPLQLEIPLHYSVSHFMSQTPCSHYAFLLCVYTMLHAHIIWYGSVQLQIRKNMGYSFFNIWIASVNIFFLTFIHLSVMLLISVTLHIYGIPLYICTTFSSSVCLLRYIYVVSISWLL